MQNTLFIRQFLKKILLEKKNLDKIYEIKFFNNTPLVLAMMHAKDLIPLFLQNGACPNKHQQKYNLTILSNAIIHSPEYVSLFLKYGADPCKVDGDGSNSLHNAAIYYPKLIPTFIKHGIDVNSLNGRGFSALHLLSMHGSKNNINELKLLLDNGAKINQQTSVGSTSLHLSNDLHVTKFLLENGADPNIKNNQNLRPVDTITKDTDDGHKIAFLLYAYGSKNRVNKLSEFGRLKTEYKAFKTYSALKKILHLGPDRIVMDFLYGLPTNSSYYNYWN